VKDCIIVGQNIEFDLKFIRKNMELLDIIPSFHRRDKLDLTSLAWWHIKDREVEGIGLSNFCDEFNISNVGAHSALIDCRRTLGVYRCLKDHYDSWIKMNN
jgi:DNA polymerase III alpha subunit (gram-positive type)